MEILGEPIEYWIKLKEDLRKAGPSAERFFKETLTLRAKISFYESRIKEMVKMMEHE